MHKDFGQGHSDQPLDASQHHSPVPQMTPPDQGTSQEPVSHLSVDMGDEEKLLPEQLAPGQYATQKTKPSTSVSGALARSRKVFEVPKTKEACSIVSVTLAIILAITWVVFRIVFPVLSERNRFSPNGSPRTYQT